MFDFENLCPVKGGVFALGNFDGVHVGHRVLVKSVIEKARNMGVAARVLTFEPHPRTLFKPDIPVFRLTPAPMKLRLLRAIGVDDVIVCPFTREFSELSAADFVSEILVKSCGVQHVMAGADFVFGHRRGGDMQALRAWLAPHNIGVTEVTQFRDAQGVIMSSTRAREALRAGEVRRAAHILGRPWAIAGTVIHGAQRGRTISVPTANIALGDTLRPKFGVYAVQARGLGAASLHQGVANIGVRPTVDGHTEMLEFHLFDFDRDIYGEEWEVELVDFIRPEQAFTDFEALRQQIMRDIDTAKALLAEIGV